MDSMILEGRSYVDRTIHNSSGRKSIHGPYCPYISGRKAIYGQLQQNMWSTIEKFLAVKDAGLLFFCSCFLFSFAVSIFLFILFFCVLCLCFCFLCFLLFLLFWFVAEFSGLLGLY